MTNTAQIAVSMLDKGRSFVMAAGLVKAYEGEHFVYLHLLCQGVECMGKALLLNQDFALYEPRLKTDFGHDLEELVSVLEGLYSEPLFSTLAMKELRKLNRYYTRHILRYGSAEDFRAEAQTVSADRLHAEVIELIPEAVIKIYGTGHP